VPDAPNHVPGPPGEAGELRVFFAAQRTMLAWVRTGVALMGFGFVVARFGLFLRELAEARGLPPTPRLAVSVWAGALLMAAGVACNLVGAVRLRSFAGRFARGKTLRATGVGPELALAGGLALLGAGLAAYLLRMR
jgi:putative membrane protein